jgi:hypothetical protein
MCGGVEYKHDGQSHRVYFPYPDAQLPVRKRDGSIELVGWGRRKEQPGKLPPSGWARLESVLAHKWDRWNPQPVKIIVDRFMEKDQSKNSHWFNLQQDEFIQGLLATRDEEQRLYVVTIEPPADRDAFRRWPRVLAA